MRDLALACLAACACAVGTTSGAANIDTGGFRLDGQTTYCEGVNEAKDPLVFEDLAPSSAGQCPIQLTLATSIKKNVGVSEVWVDWSASVATRDIATSLFPRIMDKDSGRPKPIIASLLRACKAGSNCATPADVVVPAPVAGDETSTGPFDDKGTKPFQKFVFGFPGAIDHVLVAKIVLPGDAQLNISATEFLAFQRLTLSNGEREAVPSGLGPGTVKPADSPSTSLLFNGTTPTPPLTRGTAPPRGVEASDTENGALAKAPPRENNATNVVIITAIGALACVVALALFAATQKRKHTDDETKDPRGHASVPDDATVYRLTDAAKYTNGSGQYSTQDNGGDPHQPQMGAPPPRRFQRSQSSAWKGAAPASMGYASTNELSPRRLSSPPSISHSDVGNFLVSVPPTDPTRSPSELFTNQSNLLISGLSSFSSLHDSQRSSLNSLHDSRVPLPGMALQFNSLHDSQVVLPHLSALNSLHDSAVALPARHTRLQRASSASSYGDEELEEFDEENEIGKSTRLFTEGHIHDVLHHQTDLTSERSNRLSTYSWLDAEDDAADPELAELTTVIHERYPPRRVPGSDKSWEM